MFLISTGVDLRFQLLKGRVDLKGWAWKVTNILRGVEQEVQIPVIIMNILEVATQFWFKNYANLGKLIDLYTYYIYLHCYYIYILQNISIKNFDIYPGSILDIWEMRVQYFSFKSQTLYCMRFASKERSSIGPAITIFLHHQFRCLIFISAVLFLIHYCSLLIALCCKYHEIILFFFYLIYTKRTSFIPKIINITSNVYLNNNKNSECDVWW